LIHRIITNDNSEDFYFVIIFLSLIIILFITNNNSKDFVVSIVVPFAPFVPCYNIKPFYLITYLDHLNDKGRYPK